MAVVGTVTGDIFAVVLRHDGAVEARHRRNNEPWTSKRIVCWWTREREGVHLYGGSMFGPGAGPVAANHNEARRFVASQLVGIMAACGCGFEDASDFRYSLQMKRRPW